MKAILALFLSVGLLTMVSCDKIDEDPVVDTPEYHIHVHSPDDSDKMVDETITIDIDAEEQNGQTVHHFNVRIYNKADGTEIFNEPSEAHVHETDGMYTFESTLDLNVDPDTDWILEAKVWGHEDGLAEVTKTVEFKVIQ